MKKLTYATLVFLVVGITVTACKKDKDETPETTIVGLWNGKYSKNPTPTDFAHNYAALFRSNGTVRLFDMGPATDTTFAINKIEGNYTLTGNALNATYLTTSTPVDTIMVASTVNAINAYMEGSFGKKPSTTNGGQFFLHKP